MKYKCRKCGKDFDLPATLEYTPTITVPPQRPEINWPYTAPPPVEFSYNIRYHTPCCPNCYSTEIEETKNE